MREIRLLLKRVFKRVDMMARSLIALIEPGSCFAGTLAELVFAADRSVMFAGAAAGDNRGPATLHLSALNFSAPIRWATACPAWPTVSTANRNRWTPPPD